MTSGFFKFLKKQGKQIANSALCLKINLLTNSEIGRDSYVLHTSLADYTSIGNHCRISASTIGRYSYIGDFSVLPNTRIGSFCSIASHVTLAAGMHPVHYVSTSPMTYRKITGTGRGFTDENLFNEEFVYTDDSHRYFCEIGHDVWIASCVTLVCGRNALKIGNGAVLRAGTLVTKDVPPYAIVQGRPGKIIGWRFDTDVIQRLQTIQWWNEPEKKLKEYALLFSDPETFLKYAEGDRQNE